MYSEQTVSQRKLLRTVLNNTFPGQTSDMIYEALRPKFCDVLSPDDLIPFVEAAGIPKSQLSIILHPYGVGETFISSSAFKMFFEDEFRPSDPALPYPKELSQQQISILSRFAASIRSRVSNLLLSDQWTFICSFKPSGSNPCSVRLSALCHICKSLDLALDPHDLIQALFVFYGGPLEEINFNQFSLFMQTFQTY